MNNSRLFVLFSMIALCAVNLFAQSTTLRGTVTDPQGAAVPDAIVMLTNIDTGFNREALTSGSGEYQFVQVAPGNYKVVVTKPGFAVATKTGVSLLVNTPSTLDFRVDLGKTAEVVNVQAETSTINTVDASIGNAFSQTQVRDLPLETRNVVQLLSLQPGVTTNGEVLGARRDQNNITLDGVDVNDNQNAGLVSQTSTVGATYQGVNGNGANVNSGFNSVLPIPLDSVQEFRVTVSGQGFDQGRSSGGQVVLVTKSGTNQLHGSIYEYNRNTATSANTWFNNQAGVPVQRLIRNQFGASAGGPIKKDRLFYFINWEQRTDASSVAQVRAVPSETLKEGILKVQLTDGSTQSVSPADLRQIDPLGIGLNSSYQKILSRYPVGNAPGYGQDGGLNFSGFRFNAPDHLNNMAWVAKLDYKLDGAGKHNLSLRGTLADNTQDQILAQFPGQSPASTERDNHKGLSARYTFVVSSSLINSFTFGITRVGQEFSGVSGTGFQFQQTALSPLQNWGARAKGRTNPLNNFLDDVTWTKGRHTLTAGLNLRLNTNNVSAFTNSYPLYAYGATELIGLGEDINNSVASFLKLGADVQLANPTAVTNASAALLGILNDVFVTYQYGKDAKLLPQGTPQQRSFVSHSYAGYVGDSFRVNRQFTLTFGVRYENFRPPYEANGLQVATTTPLDQFFAQRNGLQAQGIPANQMANFTLSYALNGPVNGKPSWWAPDNANLAPRVALAFAPADHKGVLGKIFGANGAFRMGGALAYDQFGQDLIVSYDQFGSLGLSNPTNFPDSYSFSTSPRFTGTFPALPPAAAGSFPYTPPAIAAITGTFLGISPSFKTPYSIGLNATFSRTLPGSLTMEIGYVARLSRRLLMEGDVYTPLENYKDPASGITWQQNAMTVYNLANTLAKAAGVPYNNAANLVATQVMNNPSLVPNLPFVNNVWPGYKDAYFPGSASANYFYSVYGVFGSSFLDSLHAADRIAGNYPDYSTTKCLSIKGCYTFFAQQGSTLPMWMNAGQANFHGLTVALRRRYSNGFQFDFNYTLSHSIDNGSAAESGAGEQGASIQDIYNLGAFRGSSDFDIRNNFNANFRYALPVGKGKMFLRNSPGWLNQAVGGWQVSSIWRYSTPLPSAVQGDLAYNSNYWLSSLAIVNTPTHSGGVHIDDNGNPSIFSNISVSNNFQDQAPEGAGTRAAVRLAPIFNVDMALTKAFNMPKEGQRLQLRAEAFNAFNHANFTNPSLSLQSPLTFGEFQGTMDPRSMQFALRFEF